MKIEYRIANINGEFFPHVRTKRFFFWSRWKKIAKHPSGFGMYPLPDTEYPKTKDQCEEIITNFHRWIISENSVVEEFYPFTPASK